MRTMAIVLWRIMQKVSRLYSHHHIEKIDSGMMAELSARIFGFQPSRSTSGLDGRKHFYLMVDSPRIRKHI
jgi:hypothetical protein